MRIFLDENMPQRLLGALRALGHEVESVNTLAWTGVANGELYGRVVDDFDLLFTKDEEFARRSGASLPQGRVRVLRVTLRQQPQETYVAEFLLYFQQSDLDQFACGDAWP